MAKYLITGGCGFIGSQLTKKLIDEGHEIIIVDDLSNGKIIHPKATFFNRDITKFETIRELFIGIQGCFHLAAIPTVNIEIEQWFESHKNNLGGSLNVFKAAIEAGNIPVVYASSCGVYGDAKHLPLEEDLFIQPLCAYGCDKLSTELNAHFLANEYQLPSMGLRFFNVYGPYQQEASPYSGVITHFITSILENKPLVIFGDGEQTRDFVFVEDVVDNLIQAMNTLKRNAHVVNICTGERTSINHLATLVSQLMNKKINIEYQAARECDAQDSYGSRKKMNQYGFDIKHNMKQGLMKTIDYFLLSKTNPPEMEKINNKLSSPRLKERSNVLTGFANLTLVRDQIYNLLQLESSYGMAILILNVDDFHLINDSIGTQYGDLLLEKIVERIVSKCINGDILARQNGDEFIFILLNHSIQEIDTITKNIIQQLSQPFLLDQYEIYITASIGLSLWPQDSEKADDLLTYANLALNQAKEKGKNNYQYYSHKKVTEAHCMHQIQRNLMHAMEQKEFYICYQPQVEINNQKIIGFEALLRWKNPQLGLISPARFISMAEKTGQIIPIGDWVLQEACREAASWQNAGKSLLISVNVSVCQLQDHYGSINHHFYRSVEQALEQTSLKPELLELEITESVLMQMNEETLNYIKKLKTLGVRFACDDFGIGYSSYSRLLQLPLDTIKIDQSLIADLSKNLVNATTVIGGMIAMTRQLGIKTVAEGVETKEQMDILQKLGCDVIQGNYFSKPIFPDKINTILNY